MTKDEIIRELRFAGARSGDGPNAFDAAADMLLGLPEQQFAAQGDCPHTFKAVSPGGTVCCACGERLSANQGEGL